MGGPDRATSPYSVRTCASACEGNHILDSPGSRVIAVGQGLKQPGGLRDSSRWSKTTGKSPNDRRHPERVRDPWIPLAPLQGANHAPRLPEVFASLRSDLRLLSNNP